MRILGIDPGLSGGLAIYITGDDMDGAARCAAAIHIPTFSSRPPKQAVKPRLDADGKKKKKKPDTSKRVDVLELQRWIRSVFPDKAVIERAQTMPDQGIASSGRYMRAVGSIEATVLCCGIPLSIISPQQWKKHFALKSGEGETLSQYKERSRQIALKVRNAEPFMKRKKDHGPAEALLIAVYGASLVASGAIP